MVTLTATDTEHELYQAWSIDGYLRDPESVRRRYDSVVRSLYSHPLDVRDQEMCDPAVLGQIAAGLSDFLITEYLSQLYDPIPFVDMFAVYPGENLSSCNRSNPIIREHLNEVFGKPYVHLMEISEIPSEHQWPGARLIEHLIDELDLEIKKAGSYVDVNSFQYASQQQIEHAVDVFAKPYIVVERSLLKDGIRISHQ